MRLFIAINLSTSTKLGLVNVQDELRRNSRRGRFGPQENFHLTLAFLGECQSEQTTTVKDAMTSVSFEPFELSVDSIGRFKRPGGDIWWAGIKRCRQLMKLQNDITDALINRGFSLESRPYNPHITLGRQVVTDYKFDFLAPFGETVSIIDLMKSQRVNGELVYTSIFRRGKWQKPIVILPYDPLWAQQFEHLMEYLKRALGGHVAAVHHVGSTSVPGLAAKPILDVDVEIENMGGFPKVVELLAKCGYRHMGDYGIPGREVFKYDTSDFMSHHLYVCPSSSPELKRHLAFRDYLRRTPEAVREYGQLKIRLAQIYQNDIDAYIDGKTEFIETCLAGGLEGESNNCSISSAGMGL